MNTFIWIMGNNNLPTSLKRESSLSNLCKITQLLSNKGRTPTWSSVNSLNHYTGSFRHVIFSVLWRKKNFFDYHVLVHSFIIIIHQISLGTSNLTHTMTDVHVLCWSPINTCTHTVFEHLLTRAYPTSPNKMAHWSQEQTCKCLLSSSIKILLLFPSYIHTLLYMLFIYPHMHNLFLEKLDSYPENLWKKPERARGENLAQEN